MPEWSTEEESNGRQVKTKPKRGDDEEKNTVADKESVTSLK